MELNKTNKRGKYKQYIYDKSIKMPRTTFYLKKKNKNFRFNETTDISINLNQVIFIKIKLKNFFVR